MTMIYYTFQIVTIVLFGIICATLIRVVNHNKHLSKEPIRQKCFIYSFVLLCFICLVYRLYGTFIWRHTVITWSHTNALLESPWNEPVWLACLLLLIPLIVMLLSGILLLWKGHTGLKTDSTVSLYKGCQALGVLCIVFSGVWFFIEVIPVLTFFLPV